MGVPKFFKWISNNYDNLIFDINNPDSGNEIKNINNLFLDANGLIHPCVRKVLETNEKLIDEHNNDYSQNKNNINSNISVYSKLEKKMFQCIYDYILHLYEYVKPSSLLYIAIDGVAPRAKIEQQRKRRYRSSKEKKMKSQIYTENNIIKLDWDTNCITPGTTFMIKLSNFLKKKISCLNLTSKIMFSDANNPNEGEHKIINYLRNSPSSSDEIHSIYGLDADLIMLSLCINKNIYLLRESIHVNHTTDQLLLFSIKNLRINLIKEMTSMIEITDIEIIEDNLITDYVFLCFLLGNDFIPKLINLDIHEDSIKDLVSIYINFLQQKKKYIINENIINFKIVQSILTNLFYRENKVVQKIQLKHDKRYIHYKQTEYIQKQIQEIDNYPIMKQFKTTIHMDEEDWQDRYYNYYLNVKNINKSEKYINDVCKKYLEGLQWVLLYYTQGCPSWSWYYPFPCAPCLRELCKYLDNRIYHVEFKDDKPITPIQQLLLVLPHSSFNLLPKEYIKILDELDIQQYYPIDYDLYTLNNIWLHECDPKLPIMNDTIIFEKVKNIPLSDLSKIKNSYSTIFEK